MEAAETGDATKSVEKSMPKTGARSKQRTTDDKNKKKDEKFVENMIRNVKPDDKLAVLFNKCVELVNERRQFDQLSKSADRNLAVLQREHDQLANDKHRQILINSRLENLCRELQRQNKGIKDESSQRIRDEEDKRKDVSSRFQKTLSEINTMMQQGNENNAKLREDNLSLNTKFNALCTQVEQREQQLETIIKQMDLEKKLADATLQQRNYEMLANQEIYKKEKEALQAELHVQNMHCDELQKSSENLRTQIAMYKEQCEEFHSAVAKSNDMFGTFKDEMDKMSKKVHQVEQESNVWQDKWEKSNNALIDVCRENQQMKVQLVHNERQIDKLKQLCRAMQTERTNLYQRLEKSEQRSVTVDFPVTLPTDVAADPQDEPGETTADLLRKVGKEVKVTPCKAANTPNEGGVSAEEVTEKLERLQVNTNRLTKKQETLQMLKTSLVVLQAELDGIKQKEDIDKQIETIEEDETSPLPIIAE